MNKYRHITCVKGINFTRIGFITEKWNKRPWEKSVFIKVACRDKANMTWTTKNKFLPSLEQNI